MINFVCGAKKQRTRGSTVTHLIFMIMIVISPVNSIGGAAAQGTWTDSVFFDNVNLRYVVTVVSTVGRTLHCTVVYNGIRVSDYVNTKGTAPLMVPPYPGFGKATENSIGLSNIGNLNYKVICN